MPLWRVEEIPSTWPSESRMLLVTTQLRKSYNITQITKLLNQQQNEFDVSGYMHSFWALFTRVFFRLEPGVQLFKCIHFYHSYKSHIYLNLIFLKIEIYQIKVVMMDRIVSRSNNKD